MPISPKLFIGHEHKVITWAEDKDHGLVILSKPGLERGFVYERERVNER